MRLYGEIFKDEQGSGLARCILSLGGGGYFEGVKAVGEFSPERILLSFHKSEVEIEGENLFIKKYCEGDLAISGRVRQIRVLGGDDPQTR